MLTLARVAEDDLNEMVETFLAMDMSLTTCSFWKLEVADMDRGTSYQVRMNVVDGKRTYTCLTPRKLFACFVALPYHKYSVGMTIKAKKALPNELMEQIIAFLDDIPLVYF